MKAWIKKLVYGAVGIAGVGSLFWLLTNWSSFIAMEWYSIVAIVLLVVGGINWGLKAVAGKDLFGLIGK